MSEILKFIAYAAIAFLVFGACGGSMYRTEDLPRICKEQPK